MAEKSRAKFLSQAEFARARGVSRKTVTGWKQKGLLSLDAEGRVDVEATEWNLDQRPATYRGGVTHRPVRGRDGNNASHAEAKPKAAQKPTPQPKARPAPDLSTEERGGEDDDGAEVDWDDPNLSLAQAAQRKENYLGLLRKLDHAVKQGLLVDRPAAEAAFFEEARAIRDALIAWPARVSIEMAEEIRIDPATGKADARELTQVLAAHVNTFLAELGEPSVRMRGVGPRGLELHPEDVAALAAQTGRSLAAVLNKDTQGPTTVVIGDLVEVQETYVARSAIPSDADHVQIEMVADDARVWQLLDEQVIAPAPVNADNLAEPLIPQISVLHARCQRLETGIVVVWGVSTTRGARAYEADISYDAGGTWEVLSPLGPASSGSAPMRQCDIPVTVRARAFGRTGLPGDYVSTTFTTVAPVVDGAQTEIVRLPPIDYAGLTQDVRNRIDYILSVEAYAIGVAAQARADFLAADGKAQDALNRALESLGNDAVNAAAILREEKTRTDETSALAYSLEVAVAKSNDNAAAILREETARTTAVEAVATSLESVRAQTASNSAALTAEQTARADGDSANASSISGLRADVNTHVSNLSGFIVDERQVRADGDGALGRRIDTIGAIVDGYAALIVTEQQARADGDSAQAQRTDLLIAQTNSDRSFLQGVSAQADADRIFLQNLKTQTDADRAYFLSEQTARINQDSAFAQQIQAVVAQSNGNTAAVSRIDKSISDIYTAQASTNIDLYARSDAGTAFGRFSMQAASSVPGGVTARLQALLAADRNGQTYGAGMVFDLMNDGTSQIRFDADRFFITSGGSSSPVFSLVNGVLMVPTIRLTSGNFLPGSVSQSNSGYTDGESIAQFGITTRPGEAVVILAESKGAPTTPVPPGQEGVLRISRDGTPLRDKAANLYALRGTDGNISFQTLANTSSYRDYPPPGYHVYQVINTNNQPGVGYTYFAITGS
ncbi:phage tail tip fiber protein [Methylorubrum zatmanii]|uniref:DUF1983 domain-containing protein n=1 Tax=Methylorubrum zatmanii TaxID=29429 RepID=A0ABW1WII9_9HYPH|nr:DUF1983 domain-containing protein [Methylorubrum zatmanii]MBD8906533.1 hypothetical protein [Methylorubrum zatmanii]